MLKDIQRTLVEDIGIAILPKLLLEDQTDEPEWEAYVINLKGEKLENVIIASKGYGILQGETVKTSTLRHYIGDLDPMSYQLVEPVQEAVFGLNNEYWLSFYIDREIFDRKYVFLPESINDNFFTQIPLINRQGVLIL